MKTEISDADFFFRQTELFVCFVDPIGNSPKSDDGPGSEKKPR